ncbi:hypothetical protein BH20ACT23_BH20ACT23_23580 [soil metagenome]
MVKIDRHVKRRILLFVLIFLVAVVAVSGYVALSAAFDIVAAKRTLTSGSLRLDKSQVEDARRHLTRAAGAFDSLPARAVGWLPVIKQNFGALQAVAESSLPVVEAADPLREALDEVERSGLINDGAVDLELLEALEEPLRVQSSALSELAEEVEAHRNGWLLPPLWSQLDGLLDQTSGLTNTAENAADLVALAPAMLGDSGERTYLVALMNNTELRGAGGILSGVGSLRVSEGLVSLGQFHHYKELAGEPPHRHVRAPEDFRTNFGTYGADTTRWVTTTSSPDVPDVALVAARLFRWSTGVDADGVILVDPRGLAAMMPPNALIEVPTTDTELTASELPTYVYRGAYEELGGALPRRRESLITIGRRAFESVLERGYSRTSLIRSTGKAVGGGHLSLVSFVPEEARVLERAGIARDLGEPDYDAVLATVQNIGGNKLDSYARRSVHHACQIEDQQPAHCATEVTIDNATPPGLSRYEYQYLPYGLFKNVVEIYAPAEADILSVEVGGSPEDFFTNQEDGLTSLGVYVQIPKGQESTVRIAYELPPRDHYSLSVIPQPLVEDARLRVDLRIPAGWKLEGPDGLEGEEIVHWEGGLDRRLEFEAGPSERSGLASWWARFDRFLDEPVL